jgi:ribosomal protein L37E
LTTIGKEHIINLEVIKRKEMLKIIKICKNCGDEFQMSNFQKRKVMCSKCAYERKKIRSSEKYWSEKAPGSTKHKYWRGRLQNFDENLNIN